MCERRESRGLRRGAMGARAPQAIVKIGRDEVPDGLGLMKARRAIRAVRCTSAALA